jgi:hypothetical protein
MFRKIHSGILLFFLFLSVTAFSQRQDFRTWWAVELEGEVFNLIDFSVAPEIRFWDNSSSFESVLAEVDLSAPITKFFRFGGMYRYQYEKIRVKREKFINRFGIYAEFDTRIERLRLAYRAMYQQEYTNVNTSELGSVPESLHRHKISFRYRGKGWDITPNIAAEMFFTINPGWMSYQQKLRLTAGAKYRLTKKINIGLAYKFQTEYYEDNPLTSHIIKTSLEYQL